MYGSLHSQHSIDESDQESLQLNPPKVIQLSYFSTPLKYILFITLISILSFAAVNFKSTYSNPNPYQSKATILSERTFYSSFSDSEIEELFTKFIIDFSKTYGDDSTSEEYISRFQNFKEHLDLADTRNLAEQEAGGEAVHGITKFSDLSQTEFEQLYLMTEGYWTTSYLTSQDAEFRKLSRSASQKSPKKLSLNPPKGLLSPRKRSLQSISIISDPNNIISSPTDPSMVDVSSVGGGLGTDSLVTDVDWSGIYTNPIREQGTDCPGGSWAFAATAQVESDAIRKAVLSLDTDETQFNESSALSVQELLSCVTNSSGCTSGSVESAYSYIKRPGAIHSEAVYPFLGSTSSESGGDVCTSATNHYSVALGSFATVTKYHNELNGYTTTQVEANMLAHLVETGTLSACLDASSWKTYVSGVMSTCDSTFLSPTATFHDPLTINQCIQVVGVYFNPELDYGYYKIRNSWGSDWGEDGYAYLAHGSDLCSITYNPGYTDPVVP